MKHTKEPWEFYPSINLVSCNEIRAEKGLRQIAYDLPEADAKRIVACVNACAGLTDEVLKANIIEDAIDLLCITESMGITHEGLAPIYRDAKVWED